MSNIIYLVGDATRPKGHGSRIIAHICNNHGRWGSGFTFSISRRWEAPERLYRCWHEVGIYEGIPFAMGSVQFVDVGYNPKCLEDRGILIANMVAQDGLRTQENPRPVCYQSLRECLGKVSRVAASLQANVIMPRIGCDRGGGSWESVEPIIQEELVTKGITVNVYDLIRR